MSRYRRAKVEGGLFFFTLTLSNRSSDLLVREIVRLRRAYSAVQLARPFETEAICILPDHIHAVWSLPESDADFPSRWMMIKANISRGLPSSASRPSSTQNAGASTLHISQTLQPAPKGHPCLQDPVVRS